MLVIHNFAPEPQSIAVDVGDDTLVNLLSNDHSHAKNGVHRITLDAYGYRWFRIGGLAYILKREK